MSLTKRNRKIQSTTGNGFPESPSDNVVNGRFAQGIADALRRDFGETHAAVKTVVDLTDANERSVKNWFMAKNGPTGQHLIDLVRTSDARLGAWLSMANRHKLA